MADWPAVSDTGCVRARAFHRSSGGPRPRTAQEPTAPSGRGSVVTNMADLKRAVSSPALLPSWRIERQGDTVRCVGGPDELHVLSQLSTTTVESIDRWITTGEVHAPTEELSEVRDFLITIGAIDVPAVATAPLQWVHVGAPAAAERVATAFGMLPVSAVADLTVVVRTAGSLAQLIDQAAGLSGRQVLLDLTGHHTISLGPFVSPGLTSCIGCYATRLSNRWGDDLGPDEPASQRWTSVASELLAIQIERIAARTSPLVNATINWDLRAGVTTRDHLLRAPDCPLCARPSSGSIVSPLGERQPVKAETP